ncbi:MAG: Cna B-type domain-containing protein, partial [Clostridia bacterium]|nr:Cna B-type domain-containing protein [Clostridia bacterium]
MKAFGKILAIVLAVMMIVSCLSLYAFGADTVWNGSNMSVEIEPGHNGYTFLSVYRKPGHAYEMSNHMVSVDGGVNNDIPQTLVLVDASEKYTWTPDGKYVHGKSNYEVLYCCDAETGYVDGIYYKRLNLEDSEYYNEEQAAHIRAIVTHSYPYITLEQMKADLKAAGLAYADELTRADIISAVQAAIWAYANDSIGRYSYSQTFDIPTNTQWGTVMHDYTSEMDVWWTTGKRKFSKDEATGNRINGLVDHLLSLDKVAPAPEEIIISDLEIVKTVPVVGKDGTFSTTLKVALNNSGSGEADTLKLDVYVDGVLAKTSNVTFGTSDYEVTVEAMVGQKISAVVSGTQILPVGAYFYAPEPMDIDGDGVATSREVSQNLVGVASGATPVFAEAEVFVPGETELTVTKTWDDDSDRDGIRPDEITVRLSADGEEIAETVLNEENGWQYTFEGLAIYNEAGELINYTVSEDAVEGYDAEIDELSVTNVHKPELTFVKVKKTWNDGDDRDALRPDEITVRLHANGQEVASQILNEENGWTVKFEDLFKYERGVEIVYTITEDAV